MQYQGHTISNPFPQYEYPPFNSFRGPFIVVRVVHLIGGIFVLFFESLGIIPNMFEHDSHVFSLTTSGWNQHPKSATIRFLRITFNSQLPSNLMRATPPFFRAWDPNHQISRCAVPSHKHICRGRNIHGHCSHLCNGGTHLGTVGCNGSKKRSHRSVQCNVCWLTP